MVHYTSHSKYIYLYIYAYAKYFLAWVLKLWLRVVKE